MNGESPLVDTSVLIDYFTGIRSRETEILDELLEHGPAPATAAIIVQEYLQGLTDPKEFALAETDLECFDRLPPPDYSLHLVAAENHVKLGRRGITIPTVDSLIVTMADAARRSLLTRDGRQRDLARFLKVQLP
jgi:predicted nucleic acid-binding protein